MGSKTTVEISPPLLRRSKALARQRGTSLKALMEEGLLLVLAGRGRPSRFVLEERSVGGKGPAPAFRDADWSAWRAAAYGDRE